VGTNKWAMPVKSEVQNFDAIVSFFKCLTDIKEEA